LILLEEIHNGFRNMNRMDIAVVDIVVHNTVVAEVEEAAQIAEAVEVHIEEAKVHIEVVEERIVELAERIVVLQEHIEVVEERIAELAERIVVLQVHIEVVEEHIAELAEHIEVVAEHIAGTVGTVDNKDIADMKDRNVVILERYSLL
jgi:chromosome segregation ATPase